jgi:RimJ/RimL family protein N-acetyltransferase
MAPSKKALNWKPAPLPGPVTLRGRYVTLEPIDAARHAEPIWEAVRGHDELWAWLAYGPYKDAADLMTQFEHWRAANTAVALAIVPHRGESGIEPQATATQGTAAPGTVAPGTAAPGALGPVQEGLAKGWATFMRIDAANGVIEVGNILFSPALKRTRAATEAMYLMASHVFDHLGYRRYEWKCNALNEPSRRAALRFGFTFEGIFRQHMVVKDRSRDTAWFSMLDHEWPARKKAFEAWLEPGNFHGDGRQVKGLGQV